MLEFPSPPGMKKAAHFQNIQSDTSIFKKAYRNTERGYPNPIPKAPIFI